MTIQWFPGHMAKALRQIEENLNLVDIVLELRDCRIPYSSSNPRVDSIIKKKPRLIILNKAGMADKQKTNEWVRFYKEQNIEALPVDCITNYNVDQITKVAKDVLKELFAKEKEKGMKDRPIKALIIGIPNVGKSTLINTLARRKAAATGDKPGITKHLKWININDEMLLLDTPGVLWPKFEDQQVGLRLAVTGAIKDNVLPIDDVALFSLDFLKNNYEGNLKERYKLETIPETNLELLELIGRKRGCLLPQNKINYTKVIDIIIHEIRNDKLGQLTFERPSDIIKEEPAQ